MATIRFILLGGFLGAGKTTTIARLARHYRERGLRVGIVTNDQAADLVDTHNLRAQGFRVGEVAGACFCCNFNELTEVVQQLEADEAPDVILAEPVGSCTDLVATVLRPLRQIFSAHFDVAPYGVIFKPSHGKRILNNERKAGFSPKAAYIFRKQLEEADFVLINRIDELSADEVAVLVQLVEREYPGMTVLPISAKTGEGWPALLEMLDRRGSFGRRVIDLDYDVYAEGEAELGWLNGQFQVSSHQPFDLDQLLMEVVNQLRAALDDEQAEIAHLKVIGMSEGQHGVANVIAGGAPAELSVPSDCQTTAADVVVNARVAVDPAFLESQVRRAIDSACRLLDCRHQTHTLQALRPGRPVPTHRITS